MFSTTRLCPASHWSSPLNSESGMRCKNCASRGTRWDALARITVPLRHCRRTSQKTFSVPALLRFVTVHSSPKAVPRQTTSAFDSNRLRSAKRATNTAARGRRRRRAFITGSRPKCSASQTASTMEIAWGRMASCAAVGNRLRIAGKTHQADWQSAAAYQAAPRLRRETMGLWCRILRALAGEMEPQVPFCLEVDGRVRRRRAQSWRGDSAPNLRCGQRHPGPVCDPG